MCLKEKNPVVPKSLKVNYWGLNDLFFSTQGCCLDIPKMPVFLQNVDAWSKFKPQRIDLNAFMKILRMIYINSSF